MAEAVGRSPLARHHEHQEQASPQEQAYRQQRPSKMVPRRSAPNVQPLVIEEKSPSTSDDRKRVLRNLLVVSMSFLLLFTAYQSMQNLQSSLNPEAGLGTASLATIYVALVLSCMFVPTYMIRRLGLKYTMVTSVVMYMLYFVANMEPSWYTLLPASLVLGMGGAPLWTSKCAYLTYLAQEYADQVGALDSAPFVAGFFGVFFMLFQTTQIWGNLIAFIVLRPPNMTEVAADIEQCGAWFHPTEDLAMLNQTNLGVVSHMQTYTLSGVYTCCVLSSIVILVAFLDPVRKEVSDPNPPMQLLVETLYHMRRGYQQLIIPLTIYSGMQQAFFSGDFTQAYISCSWGVQFVGFVMISYGLTDATCSMAFGFLVKRVGRVPIVLLAALLNIAVMILLFTWHPRPSELHNFFIIAMLWGMADASWQTQINAFYGVIFADAREPAFANYRLWESMGFIIMFAAQSHLRVYVKLVALVVALVIGIVGYLIIEFHMSGENKSPM
ncbi:protein unc-93 homolog A-like [Dermacentor variabilis]|uniref:protein unc-93 homolog A-like n=1 Tax=Dermacentor variabilis TaxID=34621 RepID=UPI003F5BDBE4